MRAGNRREIFGLEMLQMIAGAAVEEVDDVELPHKP